ncbi:polymorphic toxin type 15 domain-containing protein, partial [Aquibacillus rhizosphaerae]
QQTADYLTFKKQEANAREIEKRPWYEDVWVGTKSFVGEFTGYYDYLRVKDGVDPITGVELTAGQRVTYAAMAAASFIPIVGWGGRLARSGKGIYSTVKVSNTALDAYKSANMLDNIRKSELGLYGLASSNGFSEYITGKDILGNELTEAQRTASLGLGLAGILPLTPALTSNFTTVSKDAIAKAQQMARGSREVGRATLQGMIDSLQPNRMNPAVATVGGPMNVVNIGPLRQKIEDTYSFVVKGRGNTKYLDDVPKIKEVEVNFKRNDKHDSEEFARQLKDQEKGMNELTVDEYLKNREKYIEQGRAIEGNAAQQATREKALNKKIEELFESGMSWEEAEIKANSWLKTQAALHNPDQIAGGNPLNIGGMGDNRINSSIGSQWKYRIDIVDEQIGEIAKLMTPEQRKSTYLNVKLTH